MPEDSGAVSGSADLSGGTDGGASASVNEGTGSFDWGGFRGTLGDMGKEKSLDPIFSSAKPGEALVKSYVEAQRMVGNSIRLPGKDAKPEDRKKAVDGIMGKLRESGVLEPIPESPDKYEIQLPQIEGFKANETLLNGFKETAHKIGLPPSQAQGLFDWYLNLQEAQNQKEQVDFQNMKQGLKRELGGLYPRKMEAARRGVARYIGEDGDKLLSSLPPDIGRKLVLAFAEIGDPLLTKESVKAKIDSMMNDPKNPLNDISHRQHKEAVEEYSKLQQQYIRLGGK